MHLRVWQLFVLVIFIHWMFCWFYSPPATYISQVLWYSGTMNLSSIIPCIKILISGNSLRLWSFNLFLKMNFINSSTIHVNNTGVHVWTYILNVQLVCRGEGNFELKNITTMQHYSCCIINIIWWCCQKHDCESVNPHVQTTAQHAGWANKMKQLKKISVLRTNNI